MANVCVYYPVVHFFHIFEVDLVLPNVIQLLSSVDQELIVDENRKTTTFQKSLELLNGIGNHKQFLVESFLEQDPKKS